MHRTLPRRGSRSASESVYQLTDMADMDTVDTDMIQHTSVRLRIACTDTTPITHTLAHPMAITDRVGSRAAYSLAPVPGSAADTMAEGMVTAGVATVTATVGAVTPTAGVATDTQDVEPLAADTVASAAGPFAAEVASIASVAALLAAEEVSTQVVGAAFTAEVADSTVVAVMVEGAGSLHR